MRYRVSLGRIGGQRALHRGSDRGCDDKRARYVDGSLSAVCLRYFNVYSPLQRYDAYGNVIPIFTRQLLRGEALTVFGDGEQTRDFVHVADVAQANVRAARARRVTGAFNIGSGLRVSINELVRMMARASVTSPLVRYGPARAGDVRDSMADITAARVPHWTFNPRSTWLQP